MSPFQYPLFNARLDCLYKYPPLHVISCSGVQGILLLLNSKRVCKNIMALSLLPKIVELNQLPHRPRPDFLVLDVVEVLPIDPEAGLEGATLLLGPEGHCVGGGNGIHAFPAQGLVYAVAALQKEKQSLKS